MGRLTERSNIGWWLSELKDESSEYDDCSICCEKQQGCDCCRNCPIQKAVDKLAHYEDLEEQDRLIEQKHGQWIANKHMVKSPTAENYHCSECTQAGKRTSYCPNCGAKMSSEPSDEEKRAMTEEAFDILAKMDEVE